MNAIKVQEYKNGKRAPGALFQITNQYSLQNNLISGELLSFLLTAPHPGSLSN